MTTQEQLAMIKTWRSEMVNELAIAVAEQLRPEIQQLTTQVKQMVQSHEKLNSDLNHWLKSLQEKSRG